MNTTFLIFTCIIFLTAGALFAWFVSSDDFEGEWISIGVLEGDRLISFPPMASTTHQLRIEDGIAEYMINGDYVPVTRSGRVLRVELAAQICMEYRISIHEGHLIMTDPNGMGMVFEKLEPPE